jgi:hypothetical protein
MTRTMDNPEWPGDPEKLELLLHANELIRELEELNDDFPNVEWPADGEQVQAHDRIQGIIGDVRGGKMTPEQGLDELAKEDALVEQLAEEAREFGEIGPVMARRAGTEAEIRSHGGFTQTLAANAFMAASRGIGELEWKNRVMDRFPHSPQQPGMMREAYDRAIEALRVEGLWPWPRD